MAEVTEELIARVHRAVFAIMCDIDDYCQKNRIVYYLSGGTCLGAARHRGFIPWDDDGDLMMPRRDYERFVAGFGRAYEGKYRLGCFETNAQWDKPHAVVWDLGAKCVYTSRLNDVEMGFFVDIFPMDGLPATPFMQKRHYKAIRDLATMRKLLNHDSGLSIDKTSKKVKAALTLTNLLRISSRDLARMIE